MPVRIWPRLYSSKREHVQNLVHVLLEEVVEVNNGGYANWYSNHTLIMMFVGSNPTPPSE